MTEGAFETALLLAKIRHHVRSLLALDEEGNIGYPDVIDRLYDIQALLDEATIRAVPEIVTMTDADGNQETFRLR